jgi:hypothetical protein
MLIGISVVFDGSSFYYNTTTTTESYSDVAKDIKSRKYYPGANKGVIQKQLINGYEKNQKKYIKKEFITVLKILEQSKMFQWHFLC